MSHPGTTKPDIGVVIPATPQQKTDARAYIARNSFDDQADIIAMLGLET